MKRKILIIADQTDENILVKGMIYENGEEINKVILEKQSSPEKCESENSFAKFFSKTYKSKQS